VIVKNGKKNFGFLTMTRQVNSRGQVFGFTVPGVERNSNGFNIMIPILRKSENFEIGHCEMCERFGTLRHVNFSKNNCWVDGKKLCLTCRTSGEHILPGETMHIYTARKQVTL
jgi:hypothetical protein